MVSPNIKDQSDADYSSVVIGGSNNKLPSNSNEKLEQRYKEIIKENDGKLFEVHMKKGQAGQLIQGGSMPLIRSLSAIGSAPNGSKPHNAASQYHHYLLQR